MAASSQQSPVEKKNIKKINNKKYKISLDLLSHNKISTET